MCEVAWAQLDMAGMLFETLVVPARELQMLDLERAKIRHARQVSLGKGANRDLADVALRARVMRLRSLPREVAQALE